MKKIKTLSRHLNHYIPLFGIILAGGLGIVHFSYDQMFQAMLAIAVAVSYVFWGMIHHHLHHDLTVSVFTEYFLLGVLGVLISLSFIFRF